MPIEVTEENVTVTPQVTVNTVVVEGEETVVQVNEVTNVVIKTEEVITPLVVGVEGPQGPQGAPGAGGSTYHHSQPIAATVWNITHNLGYFPNVTVIDSSGAVVEGEIEYLDMNSVRLTFGAGFAGDAYLS
jgi:hypothetical protein